MAISLLSITCIGKSLPIQLVNNSNFPDNQVYIAVIGQHSDVGNMWINLAANTQWDAQMKGMSASQNTLHKTNGDWGYGNIFYKLSDIKDKTIYIPEGAFGGRIFFSFGSPLYIHFHAEGGYAGVDMRNPNDPNKGIRWEIIEYTYYEPARSGLFMNTSRVDAFQYPMGLEIFGDGNGSNFSQYQKVGELMSYAQVIAKWNQQLGNSDYSVCLQNVITTDNLGCIIEQPSKVDAFKTTASFSEFNAYVNQIWDAFQSKTLNAGHGERGNWSGNASGNTFTMSNPSWGGGEKTCHIYSRPSATDCIEGAGAFANGSIGDKALQAQFCAAINRGIINTNLGSNVFQDWWDESSFFPAGKCYNKYVWFFHQKEISNNSRTYAFAYDDVANQSATLQCTYPEKAVITIGGFTEDPGAIGNIDNDEVAFHDLPTSMESSTTYTVSVDYTASTSREIWICLFDNTDSWTPVVGGENKVTVSAGSGTVEISINPSVAPAIGEGYIWKCDIRPVEGAWDTLLDDDIIGDISITTPSQKETYNYWVVLRDNVSDMDSYLDLRSNEFAEWAGTVSQMVASQYEGDDALAYNVNSAVGSWFGFGVVNTSGSYYFGDLADYGLHFAYKTDYNGPLYVKLGGTNGEFSVEFTPIADNKWHTQEIRMSAFTNAGMKLGNTTDNLIFSIISENVVKTNATINVDDIYYYKTDVLPVILTGADIVETNDLSVYQPNADLLCINGTSKGSQIELININGISMTKTEATEGTSYLSINSMPSGLYLLRVDSKVIKVLIK